MTLNAQQQVYVTKMQQEQSMVTHYLGKVRQYRDRRNLTVVRAVKKGLLSYSQIAEALGVRKGAVSAIIKQHEAASNKEKVNG